MAAFSQLPGGKWRVQVCWAGIYRAATFATEREAQSPIPKTATVADLIDMYAETATKVKGKSKTANPARSNWPDVSHFSEILKWALHAQQHDINDRLALETRTSLLRHGLNIRSQERAHGVIQ